MSFHGASLPATEAASVSPIEIQTPLEHMHMDPDLITEILLKLPVKSLVRFKAVCKLWRSLISDPRFATSRFQRAAPRFVFANSHAIRTMDSEGPFHSDHVSEPINCDFLPNYDLLSVFRIPIPIEGSCRGFLLINSADSLYVWNPSTHVHKPIPLSPVVGINVFTYLYGFGYDSSKDDYVVVRVPVTDCYEPTHLPDVQFFSLRANMWKYTEGVDLPPFTSIECCNGLLFNEAIHWLAYNWVGRSKAKFIIAFDLMEKRLLEIPQPHDFLAHGLQKNFTLWVHGRFLSLSDMRRDGTCEIWVMKEYKVQTSWTKTLVISFECYHYHHLVCSTKGGDIVMLLGSKLTKYSDEGVVQGEQLEPQDQCGLLDPTVPMYTESMFSLPDVSE